MRKPVKKYSQRKPRTTGNCFYGQGLILILRSASLLTNGSAAFRWNLHYHWLRGLRQRPIGIVIQNPGLYLRKRWQSEDRWCLHTTAYFSVCCVDSENFNRFRLQTLRMNTEKSLHNDLLSLVLSWLYHQHPILCVINYPVSFGVVPLALGLSYDCSSTSEVTPKDICKLTSPKTKYNKTNVNRFTWELLYLLDDRTAFLTLY